MIKKLNIDNEHSLKDSYQLADCINKLINITSIVAYALKNLFNNINLQDLNQIINLLFKEHYSCFFLTMLVWNILKSNYFYNK